jgi:hypothetical protein
MKISNLMTTFIVVIIIIHNHHHYYYFLAHNIDIPQFCVMLTAVMLLCLKQSIHILVQVSDAAIVG